MKRLLFLVAFCCTALLGFAQYGLTDLVYLKNGSIVRGVILEQDPASTLRIQTRDGSVFVYRMTEVERIAKEPARRGWYAYDTYAGQQRPRFGGFFEGGMTFDDNHIDLLASIGSHLNPYFYLGAGAGVEYFTDAEIFMVPLYAHTRFTYPASDRVRLFADFRAGYNACFEDDIEGGFYLSALGGLEFGRISFGVGYTRTGLKIETRDPIWGTLSGHTGGFTARVGVRF